MNMRDVCTPARVDQRVVVGMAAERSATTRLKMTHQRHRVEHGSRLIPDGGGVRAEAAERGESAPRYWEQLLHPGRKQCFSASDRTQAPSLRVAWECCDFILF